MVTRTKRGKLALVEASETPEAVAPTVKPERPKALVFEDIQIAKNYFEQTGFHYLHDDLDKYDNLSGHARDIVDNFDDCYDNRQFFGSDETSPAMHSSQTPVQYVRVNPRLHASKLPKLGETIPLFTPYEVDELFELFDKLTNRSRPAITLPYGNDINHKLIDAEGNVLTTRFKSGVPAPNTYRQVEILNRSFEYSRPSHYPANFGVMRMIKGATPNLCLQTIRCAINLAVNDNGRYSLVVDYNKSVAFSHSPTNIDRFNTIFRAIGDILEACDVHPAILRRLDNVIFNKVHLDWREIESEDGCMKDVNNDCYLRRGREGFGNRRLDALIAQGEYNSFDHFTSLIPKKTKEDFINEWVDRTLKTQRKELISTEKSLIALQAQLMQLSQDYGQKKIMISLLQENGSLAFSKALKDIDNVPLVESVEFEHGCIIVTTEDLWYNKPRNSRYTAGDRAWMGKYRIYLSVTNNFMFYVNLHAANDSAHPHSGNSSNSMCMGDYDGMISSAFRALDYELVISATVSMLQDITETDSGARDRMMSLPTTKPKNGKISQRVFIFGTSDNVPAEIPDERIAEEARRLAVKSENEDRKDRVEYDDDSDDDYEDEEEEVDEEEDEDDDYDDEDDDY